MRLFTIALLSAVALFRSCGSGSPQPITQSTADRFRQSVGVNLHLEYANSAYQDGSRVARALNYLGVHHVRDGALRHGLDAFSSYVDLSHRGISFDLFLNADLGPQLSRVDKFERAAPGAVDLLEGPNEINNDPVVFEGHSGVVGARAYQAALYAHAKVRPAFSLIPVLNYTNWPPTGGRADAVNVHTYAKPGVDTRAQVARDVELAAAALPSGLPRYITETGYPTGNAPRLPPWVTPNDQANLTLISLLEAFRLGVQRTYLYELFDEASLGDRNPEAHYGLFRSDGSAKPSAIELHTLLAQLDVLSKTQRISAPFAIAIRGVHSLLLNMTSGASVLIVWPATDLKTSPDPTADIAASRGLSVQELSLATGELSHADLRSAWRIELAGPPRIYVLW